MAANTSELQEELQKLERKHADNPDGRYFVPLATAYRKAGEIDRAIELLRAGLDSNREYLSAHIVLGRCLADKGEDAAAREEFGYVLQLDPQNLVALRSLGEIAMAEGDYAQARQQYDRLLAVDPMNEDARRALEKLDSAPSAPEPPRAAQPAQPPPPAQPAQQPEAPSWSEMEDDFEAPRREAAVVTETIAELYTRQGFYDRAVEVYQELIRRRGPDPELQERLDRVERLLAGISDSTDKAGSPTPGSTSQPDPTPAPEPPPTATPDSWAEDQLSEDKDLLLGGYSANSWEDAETVPPQASTDESIRDFLVSVLTWQPGNSMTPTEAAPEQSAAAGANVAPPEEPDLGLVEGFASDRFGWEDRDEDASAAPASDPPSTPFGDDDIGLEPPLSSQMEAQAPSPAQPTAAPEQTAGQGPDESEQELAEDDLESFQEWLRSLKR